MDKKEVKIKQSHLQSRSQTQPQPQHHPPLAKRPASHVAYSLLLQIARTPSLKVLDIGCGPGRDLIELLALGAQPNDLIGVDLEAQFSVTARFLALARNLPDPPFEFVQADVGELISCPTQSERTFPPGTMSGIICYRFFHLHPPETQRALLRCLLALIAIPSSPSDLSGHPIPSVLLGLQRSLPSETHSGWTPISTSPSDPSSIDRKDHWVYSSGDWHDLLKGSVDEYSLQISPSGHKVSFGTKFFPEIDATDRQGPGIEEEPERGKRGAIEWWVKVEAR